MTQRLLIGVAALALSAACSGPSSPEPAAPEAAPAGAAPAQSPDMAVERLLVADRTFGVLASESDLRDGLSSMFADDVVMAVPGQPFARGREAAIAALDANPANAGARASWAPIRGGISADGLHGFTFGYMTVTLADGTVRPGKYLSYWVRSDAGWRVKAYRRAPRPDGDAPEGLMPPALPAAMVEPVTDAAAVAAHRDSLAAAERAFSDEAQTIGLGPAFAKYGSPDAINIGGPNDAGFVVGADAIAASVSVGQPAEGGSTVSWGPEEVIVASSGDLGVSIGAIHRNAAGGGTEGDPIPFFTIWRRPTPADPWRYIAE